MLTLVAILSVLSYAESDDCKYFNQPAHVLGNEMPCQVTVGSEASCYSCCQSNPEPDMCCDDGSCMKYDQFCRYDTSCCAEKYCGNRCCNSTHGVPCGPVCAPHAYTCCNADSGMLCKSPDICCGDNCCDSKTQSCCNDHCCDKDTVCCDGLCCPHGSKCCKTPQPHCCDGGEECTDVGENCCKHSSTCSAKLCCPDGETCEDANTNACCDANWCGNESQTCCHEGCQCNTEGGCCEDGHIFCGGGQRNACFKEPTGAGVVCCGDGTACPGGHVCGDDNKCCPHSHPKLCGQGGAFRCHGENDGDCGCCNKEDCCYGEYACNECGSTCGHSVEHKNWWGHHSWSCSLQPIVAQFVNAVEKLQIFDPVCGNSSKKADVVRSKYFSASQRFIRKVKERKGTKPFPSFHGVILPPAPTNIITPDSTACFATIGSIDACHTFQCLEKIANCGNNAFLGNVSQIYCTNVKTFLHEFSSEAKKVVTCAQNCIRELFIEMFSHKMKPCCRSMEAWDFGWGNGGRGQSELKCWKKCHFCDEIQFEENLRPYAKLFGANPNGNMLFYHSRICGNQNNVDSDMSLEDAHD